MMCLNKTFIDIIC